MEENELDAIVAPFGGPASKIDLMHGEAWSRFVWPGGLSATSGYPHLVAPLGLVRGLPVGLSFIGGAWSQPTLLRLAYAYEQAMEPRVAPGWLSSVRVRITLAVAFVHPDHQGSTILHVLLDRIARRGLRIDRMWLDRGYATVAVLDLLKSLTIPAVVACPIRGKPGGNGTRALCVGRRGYLVDHTFRNPQRGPLTVMAAVVRAFLPHKGKRRARWMVFALLRSPFKVHQVRELYRRRFGIETSYRQMCHPHQDQHPQSGTALRLPRHRSADRQRLDHAPLPILPDPTPRSRRPCH